VDSGRAPVRILREATDEGPNLLADHRVHTLTGVSTNYKMTPMVKTQVYLGREELEALHQVADRSHRSVADLIREAIRRVWLRPAGQGPVALWDGTPQRASVDHDSIYDNP
jgi:ribbon-helix-helix CopG family protein